MLCNGNLHCVSDPYQTLTSIVQHPLFLRQNALFSITNFYSNKSLQTVTTIRLFELKRWSSYHRKYFKKVSKNHNGIAPSNIGFGFNDIYIVLFIYCTKRLMECGYFLE